MAKTRMKALPSLVYQYGCKAPDIEEMVIHQMRLASRYRNRLCEIELQRREGASKIVHQESLEEMRIECERLETELEAIYEGRRLRNASQRRKIGLTQDKKEAANTIKEKLKPLRKQYVEAKKEAYQNPANKVKLEAIDMAAKEAAKEARKIATSDWGLYWGTYTLIEADATKFRKGAPPRFRGFRGSGRIGVQIQSNADTRLWVSDVLEHGGDSHFNLQMVDKKHAVIKFLIGGTDPCKRIGPTNPPVYATIRATIHRPLPEDAYISWVWLVRKKIGANFKWSVQFVLAKQDEKTEIAKKALIGWIKITKDQGETELPEWFLESTKTIHAWRGASRFAGLITIDYCISKGSAYISGSSRNFVGKS